MEKLTFTVNRFKNKNESKINDDISNNNNNKEDVNSSTLKESETIFDSQYYSIYRKDQNFPMLNNDEFIINFEVKDSIAILTTNSRILVYNYKANDITSHMFEFLYPPNAYNIRPLCSIIPNPINPLNPDLVIIDGITGSLNFFQSTKLAPSLSILKNTIKDKIKLFNAEFITGIQLFHETSILLITSQKRIIFVTFKDKFGDLFITSNEIYSNRPLISSILSRSYSVREYNNSNHIATIKTLDISPVLKSIIILESTGHIAFINNLKGSSNFTLESVFDLDILLSKSNLKFIDFEFFQAKNFCVFLVLNTDTNVLSSLVFDFNNYKNAPSLILNSDVPFIFETDQIFVPQIFLLDNEKTFAVKNNNKLVIFNPNIENLPLPWNELVEFDKNLKIYSTEKLNTIENTLSFATNKGLIDFHLKKSGKSNELFSYVKEEINQYLRFSSSSTPIIFSLKQSKLPIQQNTIKKAVEEILDELLDNTSPAINKQNIFSQYNMHERVELVTKLVVYVCENYEINKDDALKIKILNTCELLSLAEKFNELCVNENIIPILAEVLDQMQYKNTFSNYVRFNSKNILVLISAYVNYTKEKLNETQTIELSMLLKDLFINAFLKLDDNIKNFFNGLGLSTVFVDHFELLNNINNITRTVYNFFRNKVDEIILEKYSEILLGLSCFLYYTVHEIIVYLKSQTKSSLGNNMLNKFETLLEENKDKWIHIFIVLSKQTQIIPLALKYEDLTSLAKLIDSKKETIENLKENEEISEIEYANFIEDIELELDNYFEHFGYDFAKAIFSYYIKINKINVLLTNFEKYSKYLDKFLTTDLKYYKFSWICDLTKDRFNDASDKISYYLINNTENCLKDKKFQLSLGKLANLCGVTKQGMIDETQLKHQYDGSLLLVSIQEEIYSGLNELNLLDLIKGKITQERYLVEHNFVGLSKELESITEKLQKKLSLNFTEIINFLTLIPVTHISYFGNEGNNKFIVDDAECNLIAPDCAGKSALTQFLISLYSKILNSLKTYVGFDKSYDPEILQSKNNEAVQLKNIVWTKILLRRLVLREDLLEITKQVLRNIEIGGLLIQMDLKIDYESLKLIGITNQEVLLDYEAENDLLAADHFQKFANLSSK
jgi:nuclear pore complex protein Nup133